MKMLYVIDRTSRMHGYELEPSLNVKIGNEDLTLTPEEYHIDKFHTAMAEGAVITVHGTRNVTSFRGDTLTGVQVAA